MSNDLKQEEIDMPAIIEMGDLSGDMQTQSEASQSDQLDDDGLPRQRDETPESMQGKLTNLVWQDGKRRARHWFSVYGNIDLLRPYFDVEPREVATRLIASLTPLTPGMMSGEGGAAGRLHRELYGPTMVILTLISLLLLQMKTSDHFVQEGTLIGTAFTVCFGYWFAVSALLWFTANFTNTHVSGIQFLSLVGYSLFGHCVVVFISTVYHSHHSHTLFYATYTVFGCLSSARLASVLSSKTSSKPSKITIICVAVGVHMSFLLYLHFAYHLVVEDISLLVEKPIMPLPDKKPIANTS